MRDATRLARESGIPTLNLTPMIDVVFQLIIFFLCALNFRSLEKKLEVALPKDSGGEMTPDPRDDLVVRVVVRQTAEEGVPHIAVLEKEIRPDLGRGVRPLPRLPRDASRAEARAHEARHRAFWERHFAPKLRALEQVLVRHRSSGGDFRWQVDAGPQVRHEFVVAVFDTFVAADIDDVEIRGTRPPRSSD